MQRLRVVMNDSHWRYWLVALLIGLCLPVVLELCHTPSAMVDLWYMIVLNSLTSFAFGNLIKSNKLPWYLLFVFPLAFLVGAWIILPHYSYYFAIIYLCIEFLSYNLTRE